MASVIDTNNRVPGTFIQATFGVGPSTGGLSSKILLYGNKLSSASATVATPYLIASVDDARDRFGAGSELFRMTRAALAANPDATLYGIAVAESAGQQATGTITFGSGPASKASTARIYVHGERIDVAVASGDAVSAIATAVAAAINAKTDWSITASANVGAVTITAKNRGPRGNDIAYFADMEVACGVTVTLAAARMTGGATSDTPQNALDATVGVRYRYHVAPYADSTNLAMFQSRVNAAAAPAEGRRELVQFASYDTVANTTTIATGRNHERLSCAWQEGSWYTNGELAAAVAAVRAGREAADPSVNLDGVVIPGVPWRRLDSDRPTSAELVSAINNGITPILDSAGGACTIARSVTTRSQDSATHADYRVADTSVVVITDYVADDLAVNWPAFVSSACPNGGKIAPNPADGERPPQGAITPAMARDFLYGRMKRHEENGYVTNVDANLPALVVSINALVSGRLDAVIPCDTIDLLHQFGADVRQIG